MKALRSLSSASRPDSPTSSRSRRSSSRNNNNNQDPAGANPAPSKPTSAFAFTQINVASFDRAEAFFERVFGWRFVGEPTTSPSPAFAAAPQPPPPAKVAPPITPPPDHRVNYFAAAPRKKGAGCCCCCQEGHIAGGLFKFGEDSKARNFGGRTEGGGGEPVGDGEEGKGKAEEKRDGAAGKTTRIPGVIHYVAVDDIDATLNMVLIAGGKTVAFPWKERDQMARFALFEDTEGNVFGLIQYLT